ncbi:MAG TPA: LysM peptidoglycan-binding domain-containing protein [Acidimicrobiales bacterium]
MAAINIPRQAAEPWALDPDRSAPPTRTRHLPDRATRVRRRRLAALVLAVALAGGAAAGARAVAGLTAVGTTTDARPVEVRPVPVAGHEYVVQPGDTLWSIATQIAPDADPRPVVDALRAANGGPELEVGTRLTLDID